jgi:2-iminobutanoate/2-iminopropanoate deaminase
MTQRTCHSSDRLPKPVGPYSPAVACGGLLYCSGQIPLDPQTGKLVEGSIQDQTRQVLENLKCLLEDSGSDLAAVLKTTVFLQDMADFAAMNAVYAEFFPDAAPARSTIQVAGLPLGARVEIEAVAALG